MVTIDFDSRYLWRSPANNISNRPMSCITIHGQGQSSIPLFAIVDSGADYLQVEAQVAITLNLDMSKAISYSLMSSNGIQSIYPLLPGVSVTMEGKRVATTNLLLGPPNVVPIIGRTAFLAAIEFGMDRQGWLYKVI